MKSATLILLSVIIFAGCSASSHYSSLSKEQVSSRVDESVAHQEFTIDVQRALPLQGRSVSLTGGYNLRLENGMVYSHLPYYGRAYNIPYGGGDGMNFEGGLEDYRAAAGKKGETDISFKVRTSEGLHSFDINLWPNGSATIRVSPAGRQAISYTGRMKLE